MAVDVLLRASLENLDAGNVDRVDGVFQERTFRNLFKWTYRLEGAAGDIGAWRTINMSTPDLAGGRLLFVRADDTEATNASDVDLVVNVAVPADALTDGVIRFTRFIAMDARIQTAPTDETTGIAFIALRARVAAAAFRTVTLYLIGNSDFVGSL